MIKNYFKIAIRNLLKYKIFSFINIFGLAVGMTVCMLIILMLVDQTSYDQFHAKKDKVYRIISKRSDLPLGMATTPVPLANTLKKDYPFAEETTQLVLGVGGDAIYKDQSMVMRGYFAEQTFFDIFSYELEKGDRNTCLSDPNSIVITVEMANKLFGDENPIGKTIRFVDRGLMVIEFDFATVESKPVDWGSYKITGIIASKYLKSHLKFDALVSASSLTTLYKEEKFKDNSENWRSSSRAYTYIELKSQKNESDLKAALDNIVIRQYADIEKLKDSQFVAQKLTEITPGTFLGNMPSLRLPKEAYYFLSFLAIIVMVLACLNYTNLSVARSLTRAKEIGIRKVTGAKRKNLILQFLTESILIAMFAMILAINLLFLIKSGFMNLWLNRYLNFELQESLLVYFIFAGFAVFIGLLAGLFPALNLSKYHPVVILKNFESLRPGKLGLRKVIS
jgi:putative ABC transport system permease protein